MASIKFISGSLDGETFEIGADPMVVGRASACEIRVQDAGISSKHAKVWGEQGRYYLLDLGSTNGTFLNDKDVDRTELADGDKITFGTTDATFVGDVKKKPAPTQPPPRRAAPPPTMREEPRRATPPREPEPPPDLSGKTQFGDVNLIVQEDSPKNRPASRAPSVQYEDGGSGGAGGVGDDVEVSTLRGQVKFYEDDVKKLRAELKTTKEQLTGDAQKQVLAQTSKLRDMLTEKEERIKLLEKMNSEKESYYSPAEMDRERKRMEAAVEQDRRREKETLERQIREMEHRISVRGAETETVGRQLKEKDDLIKMLSEREDGFNTELRQRDDKIQEIQNELKGVKDNVAVAGGKEKELNDKVKQKNQQLADLGKERQQLVQDLAKARAVIARVGGGAGDVNAAAEASAQQEKALATAQAAAQKAEADLAKLNDELSTLRGAQATAEQKLKDATKLLDETQAQLTDTTEDKMSLEQKLRDLSMQAQEVGSLEKQLAMLKAERDTRAANESELAAKVASVEADHSRMKSDYDDLISERDKLKKEHEIATSDLAYFQSGKERAMDWEARYKSSQEEIALLRKDVSAAKREATAAKEAAAKGGGVVDSQALALYDQRILLAEQLALDLVAGVNSSIRVVNRNADVIKGYIDDCALLANCIRQINYTRLEPEQQQMLRELIDETQPDVIIKNLRSMEEENAEQVTRAKRLLGDYADAFKKEEESGCDLEKSFAKAQGLMHAVDPGTDIPVQVGAALPPVGADASEGVLFAYALLREAKDLAADGKNPTIKVDTDGLAIALKLGPLSAKAKDRYRDALAGTSEARANFVAGFTVKRCSGKVDVEEKDGDWFMSLALKGAL